MSNARKPKIAHLMPFYYTQMKPDDQEIELTMKRLYDVTFLSISSSGSPCHAGHFISSIS